MKIVVTMGNALIQEALLILYYSVIVNADGLEPIVRKVTIVSIKIEFNNMFLFGNSGGYSNSGGRGKDFRKLIFSKQEKEL